MFLERGKHAACLVVCRFLRVFAMGGNATPQKGFGVLRVDLELSWKQVPCEGMMRTDFDFRLRVWPNGRRSSSLLCVPRSDGVVCYRSLS